MYELFNFISSLFSSDPEEKEERDRLRAQKKHTQRIAGKQVLADEWHPVKFPYQATIFNIQRANKGYGSTCQISVRHIENEQYKDLIRLVNPKVKSFSGCCSFFFRTMVVEPISLHRRGGGGEELCYWYWWLQ